MDPVIFLKLAFAPIELLEGFGSHTALLSSTHKFNTHIVLGFSDPNISKGPGVGGVFNAVAPRDDKWQLEVAVELPDLLPAIDGKSEVVLNVRGKDGAVRELCLSNRMSRFHYQDGEESYHALVPRTQPWHGAGRVTGESGSLLDAAEEQLRTVAAMRFDLSGDTTEHAFEASIKGCLRTLFDAINLALDATRDSGIGLTPTSRSFGLESTPSAYVLVSGTGGPQGARLVLNMARVILHPVAIQGEQAARFRAVAEGGIPLGDVDRLIGGARSSWQDGEYEFAFLQAVIAAEIATKRAITAECVRRGVSKNKLDDNRKEMTYSWALNIGLPLCFPSASRPSETLVAAMNAARTKRNDLMHEASFNMNRDELHRLLTDTREYVDALRSAEATSASAMNLANRRTPHGNAVASDDALRERAYYAWLNRGKPGGDDWRDWFDAQRPPVE
jgi:DUF2934 family protein